jgi:sugar phosphate isomerase/epimerase
MFQIAISQTTTARWDLPLEAARLAEHGFQAISVWRPKVTDLGVEAAARVISRAGLRVVSVLWAGGFTGGDGRSFDESVADAVEAIETAEALGAATVVVHSGCRGGHTRSHAARLLAQALEQLAPRAAASGVSLAIKPMHPAAAADCNFVTRLAAAVELVERFDDPAIQLAFDLWQWADATETSALLPRVAPRTAVVQLADRIGPPTVDGDRLPVGSGSLPIKRLASRLIDLGFRGDFEFDPVGESVERLGYDALLAATRGVADAWQLSPAALAEGKRSWSAWPAPLRGAHLAGAGSRRSHASSQTVSRG